jgi:hypothetical protein
MNEKFPFFTDFFVVYVRRRTVYLDFFTQKRDRHKNSRLANVLENSFLEQKKAQINKILGLRKEE